MAGGRNQPYQRQDDSDEEAEMSDSEEEEIEELIEEFEYRLSREQRKKELEAELNRRKAAMRRFQENLDENWMEVMAPVPVSDSEDELQENDSEKLRRNDRQKLIKNTPTTSSTSKDRTTPRKQKYKKSTALVIYEWAKDRPEYEEEKRQLRQQQFRDEQTISRMAFFKLSSKLNLDHKQQLEDYKKTRKQEFEDLKKRTWQEMKPQGEDAFKKWAKLEEQKRTKEDKVKRRKEVEQLRRFYLGSTEDATFEMD